jgi:hypothetical protein
MPVRTTRRPVATAAVLTVALAGLMILTAQPAPAVSQVLPDLRMAKLTNIKLDTTTIQGHRLLRYTAQLVNTGVGAFEADGTRSTTSDPTLDIQQRIFNDDGSSQLVPLQKPCSSDISDPEGCYMFWAGDGHNHWHVNELEEGILTRTSSGLQVGALAKHGFHLVDDFPFSPAIPGAPASQVYKNCSPVQNDCNINALNVYFGISVGWVDRYNYTTVGQYIDITGLPNGKYNLDIGVNPDGWFTESDYTNNTAGALLRLGTRGVQKLNFYGGI